ncbi:efflux RND transporter periplasmic adaptor subunit [Syntrophomonas palmitatica]|uniref:efflux RND transporter periplasmic adaptor subunit n=1 Tax=Syntrophomonas palmitatica TaxID=402877 RepID=UPI0006CFF04C|nr:efflux RND transporter periplasmic adaptor subunit [Syntrophomonas palmitatica]
MGRKRLFGLMLLLLLGLLITTSGCKKEEKTAEPTFSVNTAIVKKMDIAQAMKYGGTLRGSNEVYIYPKIQAPLRVTAILAQPGDRVKAGQTLITLDSSDYEAKLKQAQAGLASALAAKKASDANLEVLKSKYDSTKKLYEAGAISKIEMDSIQAQLDGAMAGSAQAQVDLYQAMLEDAENQIAHCDITSPINGVVGSINVSLGDMVSAQSAAAAVSDTSVLETDVLVGENEVSYIKPGSEAAVNVRAASAKSFKGRVVTVASMPDPVKRNYRVRISLDNKDNIIKSGMFAELIVDAQTKKDVLGVPVEAVIPRDARHIVFVVDKNKRAREQEVLTGLKNDRYVEIVSGLQAGDEVITKGNTLVNEGTLLRVIPGGVR